MSDFAARIAAYAEATQQKVVATKPVNLTVSADGTYLLPTGTYALRSLRMLDLDNTVVIDIIGSQGGIQNLDVVAASAVTFDYDMPIFSGNVRIRCRSMIAGESYQFSFVQLLLCPQPTTTI